MYNDILITLQVLISNTAFHLHLGLKSLGDIIDDIGIWSDFGISKFTFVLRQNYILEGNIL